MASMGPFVAVLEAWEVDHDFHARHTAIRRDYRYLIDNGPVATPLLRQHAVHVPRPLNHTAMAAALESLPGTHDFAAFAGGGQEGSTVRTCYRAECAPTELWGQPLVAVELAANAFLRHMVRNIVGSLLLVGEGKADGAGTWVVSVIGGLPVSCLKEEFEASPSRTLLSSRITRDATAFLDNL